MSEEFNYVKKKGSKLQLSFCKFVVGLLFFYFSFVKKFCMEKLVDKHNLFPGRSVW